MADNTLAGLINAQQELLTLINDSMTADMEVSSEENELNQEVLELVTSLLSKKADQVSYVISQLMPANIASLKAQAKMYQQAAAYQASAMERFKAYIERIMVDMDVLSLQGETTEIKLMDSPPSVKIGDVVPEDFAGTDLVETRVDYVWKKDAIKSLAAKGEDLPAGIQVVRGKHLKFKPLKI